MTGASPSPKRPPLVILIALSGINPLALNIFVPSMPGMEQALGTTYAKVQLALSVFLGAVALAQLLIGPLSDRFGRRPVMLAGMGLFLVGTLICRFAPTIEVLIFGRVIQGAGSCTGVVLSRAIVRDLYDRNSAASMIGYVTMGMAVAPTIGPAIGGFLDEAYGWRASFDLLFVFGVVVVVAAWRMLHETHHDRDSTAGAAALVAGIRALLADPAFRIYAATSTFTSGVFFAYLGGAPYVAQKLMGVNSRETGLWFVSVAAGYVIGNFLSGRHSGRFGIARMITAGNVGALVSCLMIAVLLLAGFRHPAAIFVPSFFLGIANGISMPSTIAAGVSVRPDLAGAASGLMGSLQVGIGAAVTVGLGLALSDTPWPMVVGMVALAAGALLTGLMAVARTR